MCNSLIRFDSFFYFLRKKYVLISVILVRRKLNFFFNFSGCCYIERTHQKSYICYLPSIRGLEYFKKKKKFWNKLKFSIITYWVKLHFNLFRFKVETFWNRKNCLANTFSDFLSYFSRKLVLLVLLTALFVFGASPIAHVPILSRYQLYFSFSHYYL